MSIIDLTTILGNISQSFIPLESLAIGLGYMLGVLFVITGLFKLTKVHGRSREKASGPIVCILGGTALIYMPSTMQQLTSTLFGTSSILQYTTYQAYSVYGSVRILMQAMGIIWFVRGAVLLVNAGEPGKQHGMKGLMFVMAGILSVNFDYTVGGINKILLYCIGLTMKVF